ncbi:MAG: 3-oxoadipate enol-lactonase [Beijerinckiaceae bacterium]
MPIKKINGEPFNIQIDGTPGKPVLLFCDSLSANLSMWDPQVAALGKKFHIVRYDSRGHGKSVVGEGPYSIAQLGRDALAIMDLLKIEKAHFCGLSKGGMTGMWLAVNAPQRFHKMVLANTAPSMGPPDLWNTRIAAVRKGGMEVIADATLQRWFTPKFLARDPARNAQLRKMVVGTPAAGYCASAGAIRDMDQRWALRSIDKKILIIAGTQDGATPPERSLEMKKSIKGSTLVKLDASHISNIEQPDDFSAALKDFFSAK